ncbi:hypothetical protein [Pseudomonas aeruginosa]|uniref:hypothetical protein n=1 Tax=Pseudomonas aeruginosa TaxID=287 RepID=UPI003F81301B
MQSNSTSYHYLEFVVAILMYILIMPVNGIFDVFDMLSIYIIYKLIVSNNTWLIMRK